MELLTFIVGCKGRLDHLKQTLPILAQFPNTRCIVVDFDCPEKCGDWVEHTLPKVQVIRVPNRPRWLHAEVRNKGMQAVETPWVCFTDADIRFDPKFVEVVAPLLRPRSFFCAAQYDIGTAGTIICSREDFHMVEGYDEMFQDWGFEDADFRYRLDLAGARKAGFPDQLVEHIDHDNSIRVQFHDAKEPIRSWAANKAYALVKWNLMAAVKGPVSKSLRSKAYRWAVEETARVYQGKPPRELKLVLERYELDDEKCHFQVGRALLFTLEPLQAGNEQLMPGANNKPVANAP